MNPIANLPATQNLNKAQQSQGYNRQYFGGDEVDEVVLSNQEEQKKKKAWTIGGAILGAMALIGGCVFGANYFGYMGKDAKHLKGFKTLTTKNGDTTQELASIAKTTKAWTGASWGGVAETIKTTLDGKNDTKFKKIVLVASEDSQKALKESLGEDLFKKLTVIQANSDKIEDAVKQAAVHGKDKDNLIITDSSIDNLYDEIEKAITPSDNSENTKDAKEEKKAEKPKEAKAEANKEAKAEKIEEAKIEKQEETLVNTSYNITDIEDANTVFSTLKTFINSADTEKDTYKTKSANDIIALDSISDIKKEIDTFYKSHNKYLSLIKATDLLETYCQEGKQKLEKEKLQIQQDLSDLEKKSNNPPEDDNQVLFEDNIQKQKQQKQNKQEEITAKIAHLEEISKQSKAIKNNNAKDAEGKLIHPFWNVHSNNKSIMKELLTPGKNGKNKLIECFIQKHSDTLKEIKAKQENLKKKQDELMQLKNETPTDETKITTKESEIEEIRKSIPEALSKEKAAMTDIQTLQTLLRDLQKLFMTENQATAQKKAEEQKLSEKNANECFEASIKFDELPPL